MASNSQKYVNLSAKIESNLTSWKIFVGYVNNNIIKFESNIDYINERLDDIIQRIEALSAAVSAQSNNPTYVAVNVKNIELNSSATTKYATQFTIMGNSNDGSIYVYANKNVKGLYINDVQVSKFISDTSSSFFITVPASTKANFVNILSDNADIVDDISICFSTTMLTNVSTGTFILDSSSLAIVGINLKRIITIPDNPSVGTINASLIDNIAQYTAKNASLYNSSYNSSTSNSAVLTNNVGTYSYSQYSSSYVNTKSSTGNSSIGLR